MTVRLALLALFACFFLSHPVLAQTSSPTPSLTVTTTPSISVTTTPELTPTNTPSPTVTSSPLAISSQLKINAQYPWNKDIPVTIELSPRIDAQILEVRWPTRTGFTISPKTATLRNVQKDSTYSVTFIFSPIGTGLQRFSAELILTTSESKYISSVPLEITLNSQKLVTPITDGYKQYEILMYAGIGIILFIVVPASIFLFFFYIKNKLIPKWVKTRLNEPL